MMNECKMVNEMLNAIYLEEVELLEALLDLGADPNWIVNGFPLIMHAVYVRNRDLVYVLVASGAQMLEEALGFALEQGIGEMIKPFVMMNVSPKPYIYKKEFGPIPSRFSPINYIYEQRKKDVYEQECQLHQNVAASIRKGRFATR